MKSVVIWGAWRWSSALEESEKGVRVGPGQWQQRETGYTQEGDRIRVADIHMGGTRSRVPKPEQDEDGRGKGVALPQESEPEWGKEDSHVWRAAQKGEVRVQVGEEGVPMGSSQWQQWETDYTQEGDGISQYIKGNRRQVSYCP